MPAISAKDVNTSRCSTLAVGSVHPAQFALTIPAKSELPSAIAHSSVGHVAGLASMTTTPATWVGYREANAIASAPPNECPTATYGPGSPTVVSRALSCVACVVKVCVGPAGPLDPVPGRAYEQTRARAAMSGSTLPHFSSPLSKPAINSTVASPLPTQRTWICTPSTSTISSRVVVGRSDVAAAAVAVVGAAAGAVVVEEVVGAVVVDVAGGSLVGAALVDVSPPHAAVLIRAAPRIATPKRRRKI